MIQVQINIELSADETRLGTAINVLAREDATDGEREIAHVIEQGILALARAAAGQAGDEAVYTETLIGAQHEEERQRLALETERDRLRAAVQGLLAEPYGCPRCDSGKLRKPERPHTDDCPYALALAALGN